MAKKTRIKICIVVVIIWLMWFSDWSFAEDATEDWLKFLWFGLNIVLSVLGWIWIVLANIAWTFLTNKWVYGEVFWWDVLLWKFWNIARNFANFWLWLYFIYIIFKWLINQAKWEDATKNLKDTILWLLIAWIWIQSSRFLTATVVDVSSITLAAAWSFPSQVLSESQYTEESLQKSLKDSLWDWWKNISLFPKDAKESSFLKTSTFELDKSKIKWTWTDVEKLIDSLMPNQDDVSWPLYFIWFSFLKTNVITSVNTSSKDTIKSVILNMLIQSWTSIVFSIEVLMLCIIALMRIVYLWMFIVLSPIVVLLKCLEKMWDKDLLNTNAVKSLWKQFSLKTFLINTFKPTFIVLWLWIAVIFVSLMKGVIIDSAGKSIDIWWTEIGSQIEPTTNTNMDEWDRRYTSSIDLNLLKFVLLNAWKTLLEVILSIIVVIMIYFIVHQAMKLWWWDDFISKKISWISSEFQDLVMKTPIIPVPWYDKNWIPQQSSISFGGLASLPETFIDRKAQRKIDDYSAEQTNKVMEMWWFNSKNSLSATEENDIKYMMDEISRGNKTLNDLKEHIKWIKTPGWKWMTLSSQTAKNNGFWFKQFGQRLTNMNVDSIPSSIQNADDWNEMIIAWKDSTLTNKTIEEKLDNIFNNHNNRIKAYAELFDLVSITDWQHLKDADISKE